MLKMLKKYFSSRNIEYFSVLDYSDCIEVSPHIISRENFTPRTVILYLLPYYTGECVNLSRYAASLDYHLAISEVNSGLEKILKTVYPNAKMRGYGDHSPIDERHAALVSGLGIAGKNGLVINEKYGSYIFVGDMITDVAPSELSAGAPREILRCEGCGACLAACPTGILRGTGDECLSAITQKKGELSDSERALMKKYNTLWGCDECQASCPHNRNAIKTPIEFFYEERIPYLTEEVLDGMDDESFSRRAFAWRKRKTVERNIAVLFEKNANK